MDWLTRLLGLKRPKIQTFTYYIPAPPARKTGYREKEFDNLFYQFVNQGFRIISFQTVPHTGANQCGMWVIFAVEAVTAQAQQLGIELDLPVNEDSLELPELGPKDMTDTIQGLYPLESEQKSKQS